MESMTEAGGKKGVLCEGCRVGRTQDERNWGQHKEGLMKSLRISNLNLAFQTLKMTYASKQENGKF